MSKVKTDFSNARGIGVKLNQKGVQLRVAEVVTTFSQRLIASGQSPIRGDGRFTKYKNEAKYPGKRKPRRPVNLNLTGEMLRYLRAWIDGNKLYFGFRATGTPEDVLVRAKAHQEGTADMAARPMVPTDGREFAVSIQKAVNDIYVSSLRAIIRASRAIRR
jgi:hypothetical protein